MHTKSWSEFPKKQFETKGYRQVFSLGSDRKEHEWRNRGMETGEEGRKIQGCISELTNHYWRLVLKTTQTSEEPNEVCHWTALLERNLSNYSHPPLVKGSQSPGIDSTTLSSSSCMFSKFSQTSEWESWSRKAEVQGVASGKVLSKWTCQVHGSPLVNGQCSCGWNKRPGERILKGYTRGSQYKVQ